MTSSDVANPIWGSAVERRDNPTGDISASLAAIGATSKVRRLAATFNRLHLCIRARITRGCEARNVKSYSRIADMQNSRARGSF